MAAARENPDLVYKIALLQSNWFEPAKVPNSQVPAGNPVSRRPGLAINAKKKPPQR
jgi:hypothetical protein